MSKARRIVGLGIHVLVAPPMIMAGSLKVSGLARSEMADQMGKIGLADKMILISAGELTAALLRLVSITSSLTTPAAAEPPPA
jgi:hypothetical protein